jgi:hypothetical protein
VAIVFPLAMALFSYPRLPPALKWLSASLVLGGLSSIVMKLYAMEGQNNMPAFHVYTILEFLLLSLFYRQLFKGKKLYRLIPAAAVLYTGFWIINILLWQPLTKYNSYSRSAEALLLILYALAYFKYMLDGQLALPYYKAINWINTGLLLYFSGALSLFICGNLIMTSLALNTIIWNIHASLVLLMYLFFTIGLYHAKRTA